MSGGNAIGPMVDILKTLGRFGEKFQIIAIAGHNQKSYLQLNEVFQEMNIKGQVLGFVDNVQEYMATADLLISKAGGLTVTEAITIGLPMAIIQPTPGQEDGNTTFLTKAGSGVYLKNIKELEKFIFELLSNPSLIEQMRHNAMKLYRPNATRSILAEIDKLIQEKRR
jgi:processive 1,2-diacylglycerol beta-glucosyltransferase